MTLFLASVDGADEAAVAFDNGADIIDLKDAHAGALGALQPTTVRAAVAAVAGRRPLSAVAGDPRMEPHEVAAAASRMAETGVAYVKVGLFPAPHRADCLHALAAPARRVKLIGVMFADSAAERALLPVMAECGFAGVMLDTADKAGGSLLERMEITEIAEFIAASRARGLMVGVAGSLEIPDIPRLLALEPDVLGFRGALCEGQNRTARISPASVRLVRELIPLDERSAAFGGLGAERIDYRLLAARGYSAEDEQSGRTDRTFVRDFVLPVRIGAYARERERAQRVRFNVDAEVHRPAHAAEDMRDVFSYDVVTDGIRMIVAHEHIALLETLAERVASLVLAHERVVRVTVRAEKLDVGPGAVGVEITRERPAEVADVHQLYPGASAGTRSKAAE